MTTLRRYTFDAIDGEPTKVRGFSASHGSKTSDRVSRRMATLMARDPALSVSAAYAQAMSELSPAEFRAYNQESY